MQTKEYINNRRKKRRESGLCIYCAVPVNGRSACKKCSEKSYYRSKKRGDRMKYFYKHRERLNKENLERYYKRKYGGYYHTVIERDGFSCIKCGKSTNLIVHHIDGNGYNSKNPNNDINNLITLCNSCHGYIHGITQKKIIYKGKEITCSECNQTKKLWNKKNWCCRSCYINNHMYLTVKEIN